MRISHPEPTPSPKPPQPDAADVGMQVDASSDVCVQACLALRTVPCREGFSVDGGQSCEQVCQHTMGGVFDIHPECLAKAKTKADVIACGAKCEVP